MGSKDDMVRIGLGTMGINGGRFGGCGEAVEGAIWTKGLRFGGLSQPHILGSDFFHILRACILIHACLELLVLTPACPCDTDCSACCARRKRFDAVVAVLEGLGLGSLE